MSHQEFESYLRLLCRFLHLSSDQRETIARELRDHMEDRLEELMAHGHTREEAIQSALDEFGDAAALAGDFGRIGQRRKWIMRTTGGIIGIAAAVLFVSFLLPENRRHVPAPQYTAAADNAKSPRADRPSSQPASGKLKAMSDCNAEAEAKAKLAMIVPEVEFPEGSTLEQVIDFLREQSKLSIDVNWNALSLVGVDRTATLSLNLHNVKIDTALSRALANVGGASGVQLGYELSDGIVSISSTEDLNRNTFTHVYDCKDLLRDGVSDEQLRTIEQIYSSDMNGVMPRKLRDDLASKLKLYVPDLVDLIKHHVDPGSWVPEGTTGSLDVYDGLLVVTHTSSAQGSVVQLLKMMREAKQARLDATTNTASSAFLNSPLQVGFVDVKTGVTGGER